MASIHRTERFKIFFNFQMPPTSHVWGTETLECFESLEEVLRGFVSSTSQTCNVNKILTLFSRYPRFFWASSSTLSPAHHPFSPLISEPVLLPSPGPVRAVVGLLSQGFRTSSVSICFSSTSYPLIYTRKLNVEEKVKTNILRIFLDEFVHSLKTGMWLSCST